MVKLSDFVFATLADHGVRHVFLVTGGGSMHLNDSAGKEQRLRYVCNHHEQACAMAAEAYARVTGRLGVINVTTGPGGLNALNGVFGAYTDSIPMLILSGQVKRETCLRSAPIAGLRQLGDQEVDIVRTVAPFTKYAAYIDDPNSIAYHLERALYLAQSGRPGPCWLDIPVDVQAAQIEPQALRRFDPAEDPPGCDAAALAGLCRDVLQRLRTARRPVILVGSGIRVAHATEIFESVIRSLGIPVVTAWTAIDLLASDDPLYCGRPGAVGDRAGNFAVQNSDVLLVIGSRLPIRQTSYNWDAFAREAFFMQVDVDEAELRKPMIRPDLPIHADARLFLEELMKRLQADGLGPSQHRGWLDWCKERVRRYPVLQPHHRRADGPINPYHFFDVLFGQLAEDDVVTCGDGAASVIPFQVGAIRKGQRVFTNAGSASMGYDLPSAIGAAFARPGRRVICIAGDGSLQLNIQELQTVVHHNLPIKLFVLNNGGYLSIRTTQQNFFGRLVGEGPSSGVSFPDIVKVAEAYGLPAVRVEGHPFETQIAQVLAAGGPVVCEVVVDPAQPIEPKASSRQLPDGRMVTAPLEDMAPFLSREELRENLLGGTGGPP